MPKVQNVVEADPLGQLARGLAARLSRQVAIDPRTILRALHETLDGADEPSRRARLSAQLHLASVAEDLVAGRVPSHAERMLSTVEAAELMACSRPYVAMLVDSGQLAGTSKTAGGHRKVPLSSIETWLASREAPSVKDYRAAGKAAGLYGVDEAVFVKAARRAPNRARG
ncbi:MAG: helix-turn-helix domain-containing protein [Burkholderiales bacterium]|nr:helix-turn-helix domain-containing protein [Burkholderiales bacterium]